MPTIEITAEQAVALARGEDVTLAAPKIDRYICVHRDAGGVFMVEYEGSQPLAWTRLRNPDGYHYVTEQRRLDRVFDPRARQDYTSIKIGG